MTIMIAFDLIIFSSWLGEIKRQGREELSFIPESRATQVSRLLYRLREICHDGKSVLVLEDGSISKSMSRVSNKCIDLIPKMSDDETSKFIRGIERLNGITPLEFKNHFCRSYGLIAVPK